MITAVEGNRVDQVGNGAVSGWYPDPTDASRLRKWDGVGWTDAWMAAPSGTVRAPRFTDPAWHDDPFGAGQARQRWWDGTVWTNRVRLGRSYQPRPGLPRWFFGLALCLRVVLLANGLLAAVSFGFGLWTLSLTQRGSSGEGYALSEGETYDSLDVFLGLSTLAMTAVTGTLFVTWLWAAYRSDQVDPVRLTHGSGWTIGVWFVPFLNLVRPYRLVRDLRAGIRSGLGDERPDPRPHSVAWWWGSYLVMLFSGSAVGRLSGIVETATEEDAFFQAWRVYGWATMVSGVATAVAAYLAYMLVTRLTMGLRRTEFRDTPASTTEPPGLEAAGDLAG